MKKDYKGQYCIVRTYSAGVFAGNVITRNGKEVEMENVRRLHYWDGAASLSQLAKEGVNRPQNCRFTVTVDSLEVLEAIEIIPCSELAEANIKGVAEWKI